MKFRQIATIATCGLAVVAGLFAAANGNMLAAAAWGVTAIAWLGVIFANRETAIWRDIAAKWERQALSDEEIVAISQHADDVTLRDIKRATDVWSAAVDLEAMRGTEPSRMAGFALAAVIAAERDRQATK
ncbi:hypothetical protein Bra3105_06655 [Brachybacterium halotolerans subsp. kimchii]|uniref:hypothetical protein n=1 Tax=Brachybacterium halotolerans TaxID=2795215 RepID=UPI001E5E3E52|nr:hypothetical protein [Brachybacterium halotolerans]UEJ83987.1 hypothetical protein Bra3105_06655 [Brachybacterium halotolerans subsp. kimchii]